MSMAERSSPSLNSYCSPPRSMQPLWTQLARQNACPLTQGGTAVRLWWQLYIERPLEQLRHHHLSPPVPHRPATHTARATSQTTPETSTANNHSPLDQSFDLEGHGSTGDRPTSENMHAAPDRCPPPRFQIRSGATGYIVINSCSRI